MSPVETLLAEVLAAHGLKVSPARGVERCWCGESTVGDLGWYHAHVAAEQAKALREWLTSDETVGAVLDARGPGQTVFPVRSTLTALADVLVAALAVTE